MLNILNINPDDYRNEPSDEELEMIEKQYFLDD